MSTWNLLSSQIYKCWCQIVFPCKQLTLEVISSDSKNSYYYYAYELASSSPPPLCIFTSLRYFRDSNIGFIDSSPLRTLRSLYSPLSRLIKILLRQPQQRIDCSLSMFRITTSIWIEHSRIQHFKKANAIALLHLLHTSSVPLLRWFLRDRPVALFRASDTESRSQHLLLADGEGVDVHYPVFDAFEASVLVRAFGLDWQAEDGCYGAADLWPCGYRYLSLPLVEEGDVAVSEVETEGIPNGQAPLVPEARADGDVRALPQVCNSFAITG